MKRLQLYITMTAKAYDEKVEVNPDKNVHANIVDLKPEIAQIEYDKNKKNIFYMLRYASDGFFVTVVRTIPADKGNNVSAWIYVPYSAEIDDHALMTIIEAVAEKIGAPSIEKKDIADLRRLFGTEYGENPKPVVFDASGYAGYAFRNYGTGTHVSLADLLGQYRFQKAYLPFMGVFLVDADITTRSAMPSLTDIPLESIKSLIEPEPEPVAAKNDLPTRKKTYHFQIPAKSAAIGSVIEFEITTTADLDDSPIDGYEPTAAIQEGAGRSNHLMYAADNKSKRYIERALYAIGGCLVGIIAMLALTCGHDSDTQEAQRATDTPTDILAQQNDKPSTPPAEGAQTQAKTDTLQQAQEPVDVSLDAAIKYLDSNKTWEKSKMESYPDLRGLYDDMNNIQRRKLVEEWGPKLIDSRAFTNQIVHHARLSYKKKARLKEGRSTFNPDDHTEIFVQSYLNTIDP